MKHQLVLTIDKRSKYTIHVRKGRTVSSGEIIATVKNKETLHQINSPSDSVVSGISKTENAITFSFDSTGLNIQQAQIGGLFVNNTPIGTNVALGTTLGYISAFGVNSQIQSNYSGIVQRLLAQSGRNVLRFQALYSILSQDT